MQADAAVGALAFSPDGARIVSGGWKLHLWDTASYANLAVGSEPDRWIAAVAFDRDGGRIASGNTNDSMVRLWDPAAANVTRILRGHAANVRSVAFSPDGRRLFTGSYDHTIKVWSFDPETA